MMSWSQYEKEEIYCFKNKSEIASHKGGKKETEMPRKENPFKNKMQEIVQALEIFLDKVLSSSVNVQTETKT